MSPRCGPVMSLSLVILLQAVRAVAQPPTAEPTVTQPPPVLQGEIFVFDLWRLELFRAEADGTELRRVQVEVQDLGGGKAAAVATGASGAVAGAVGGSILGTSTAGAFVTVGLVNTLAAAATAGVLLPAFGITKAVQVSRRHHRPLRSLGQARPLAAIAPRGDRLLLCSDIERTASGSNLRLLQITGEKGTGTKLLRKFPIGGTCPDISFDGRHATFVSALVKRAPAQLLRLDLETGSVTFLTTDSPGCAFPRHSPDGRSIAFQQLVDAPEGSPTVQVFVIPSSGGTPRQVTQDPVAAVTPSWSPDGRSIIHGSLADGSVRAVGVDGGGGRILVEAGNLRIHPQASADGALVMYLESDEAAFTGSAERPARPRKQTLGEDLGLRVTRVADGVSWGVPLSRGESGRKVLEKTNLFWFQWLR